MTEVVPFKAEHLTYITETGMVDEKLKPWILPAHGERLETAGGTFTCLDDGAPVAVGGVIEYWHNRGEAWILFGKPRTKTFVTIFKMAQRVLDMCPLKRIEIVVDYEFDRGHKMARLLGFNKEAEILKSYRPDGGAVSLYAIVRG